MLKGIALLTLLVLAAFNMQSIGLKTVMATETNLKESLNIYHLYNETVFLLNITYYNNTDILKLNDILNYINNYTIIIFNINQTERTLRWFLSQYNPLYNSDSLIEKGILLKFYSDKISNINLTLLINKSQDLLRARLILLNKTSNYISLIGGGNYTYYIKRILSAIHYSAGGLYNLTQLMQPNGLVYQFDKSGLRKLYLLFTSSLTTSPEIKTSKTFKIDYTRYLENLTRSDFSSYSEINFYLFGINAINSTLDLKWNVGYNTHWISQAKFIISSNNKLGKVTITASKLDPFIIIAQRFDPAVFNSTSKLLISVFNLGSFNVTEVKVNFKLPQWLNAPNDTLIFKNVSTSIQEKSVDVKIVGSVNPGTYEISAPIATYNYGSTNFTTIGNTFLIGVNVKKFAALSFYLKPSSSQWPDLLSTGTDIYVVILNTGNSNATNVHLKFDYLDAKIPDLAAKGNLTFPITIQPSQYSKIPIGADVFYNTTLSYDNGTKTFNVNIPSSSLATIGSLFSFVNYLTIKANLFSNNFNLGITGLKWTMTALGLSRSSALYIPIDILKTQNLTYAGADSFSLQGDSVTTVYTVTRGYSSDVFLRINITSYNSFVIPLYQKTLPLTKKIIMDPLVFTSALIINKSINSTIVKPNQDVEVKIEITNKGESAIYNLTIQDILAKGWNITQGNNKLVVDVLSPDNTISLVYKVRAISPISPNMGQIIANFTLNGLEFEYNLTRFEIKIYSPVQFSILNWNKDNLNEGYLIIYDKKGNMLANVTISSGKASWDGYIGNFTAMIYYKKVNVLMQDFIVTSFNNTFIFRTYVFDLKVKITDLFGNTIDSANVMLIGNLTSSSELANNYFYFHDVPKGIYNLVIKIGNYEYKIPINVDETTSSEITISLPILVLGNGALNVNIIVGIILILFIALFAYYYVRIRAQK
jgi:uncharacterized repeat protein (TIGR01451 family)